MEAKLNPLLRLLTLGAAAALLWPSPWYVHSAGLLVLSGIFIGSCRASRRDRRITQGVTR